MNSTGYFVITPTAGMVSPSRSTSKRMGGNRHVQVPEVVVHRLEVPHQLTGQGIDRDDRVGEQVVPRSIEAVEVVVGRAERHVENAPLLVDGEEAPGVGPADVAPGIVEPGLVTHLAGMRDGVKGPHQIPRPKIPRPHVTGWPLGPGLVRVVDTGGTPGARRRRPRTRSRSACPGTRSSRPVSSGRRIRRCQTWRWEDRSSRSARSARPPRCRRRSAVASTSSPSQYASPRMEPPVQCSWCSAEFQSPGAVYSQISSPVSGSIATTR